MAMSLGLCRALGGFILQVPFEASQHRFTASALGQGLRAPLKGKQAGWQASVRGSYHFGEHSGLLEASSRMSPLSLQLRSQLEQTEAVLQSEQTRRQQLAAEFEEVRSGYPAPLALVSLQHGGGQGLEATQMPQPGPGVLFSWPTQSTAGRV